MGTTSGVYELNHEYANYMV